MSASIRNTYSKYRKSFLNASKGNKESSGSSNIDTSEANNKEVRDIVDTRPNYDNLNREVKKKDKLNKRRSR